MILINYFYKSHRVSCGESTPSKSAKIVGGKEKKLSFDEKNKLKNAAFKNKILRLDCPRRRSSSFVSIYMDGEKVGEKIFKPSGLGHDGLTYINWEQSVPSGIHKITLKMAENKEGTLYPQTFLKEYTFKERQILFIDFNQNKKQFFIRK